MPAVAGARRGWAGGWVLAVVGAGRGWAGGWVLAVVGAGRGWAGGWVLAVVGAGRGWVLAVVGAGRGWAGGWVLAVAGVWRGMACDISRIPSAMLEDSVALSGREEAGGDMGDSKLLSWFLVGYSQPLVDSFFSCWVPLNPSRYHLECLMSLHQISGLSMMSLHRFPDLSMMSLHQFLNTPIVYVTHTIV